MEQLNSLKAAVESLQDDAEKFFDKGNAAAAVRLRKGLQSVKEIVVGLRKVVTETKKANKTKK